MNLRISLLMIALILMPVAMATDLPHFVKSIPYAQDGKTIAQPAVLERSVAWILKRDPDYWVRLESFYCDGDREKDDDPVEKFVNKANARAVELKTELQKRKIRPDAIGISVMGKSPDPTVCLVKILAGPVTADKSKATGKTQSKPAPR